MKSTTNTFADFKINRESSICKLLQEYTLFWGIPLKYICGFLLFVFFALLFAEAFNCLSAFLSDTDNKLDWRTLLLNKLKYLVPLGIICAYSCYKKCYALKAEVLIVQCCNIFLRYEDTLCNYFEYQKKERWIKNTKEEINHYQCLKQSMFYTYINKMKSEKIYCLKKECLDDELNYVQNMIKCEEEENRLKEDNCLLEKKMRELEDIILSDCSSFLTEKVSGTGGQNPDNISSVQEECEKLELSASLRSKLKQKTYQRIEADIKKSTLAERDKEKIKSVFCELFAQTSLLKI